MNAGNTGASHKPPIEDAVWLIYNFPQSGQEPKLVMVSRSDVHTFMSFGYELQSSYAPGAVGWQIKNSSPPIIFDFNSTVTFDELLKHGTIVDVELAYPIAASPSADAVRLIYNFPQIGQEPRQVIVRRGETHRFSSFGYELQSLYAPNAIGWQIKNSSPPIIFGFNSAITFDELLKHGAIVDVELAYAESPTGYALAYTDTKSIGRVEEPKVYIWDTSSSSPHILLDGEATNFNYKHLIWSAGTRRLYQVYTVIGWTDEYPSLFMDRRKVKWRVNQEFNFPNGPTALFAIYSVTAQFA